MVTKIMIVLCISVIGLFLGGSLVGVSIMFLRNRPKDERMKLIVHSGGSLSTGCMSLVGAVMILVGFIMPWFLSISGLNTLFILVSTFVLAITAGASTKLPHEIANTGFFVILLLLALIVVIALIPIMGVRIGIAGYELMLQLVPNSYTKFLRKSTGKNLVKFAIIGLIPLGCYFSLFSMINIPDLDLQSLLGKSGQIGDLTFGAWMTVGGFILALVAGITISTLVALTEQLPSLVGGDKPVIAEEKPLTKICPKCGKEIPLKHAHCIYCGADLLAAP